MSAQKKVYLRKDFLPKLISDGEQKNAIFLGERNWREDEWRGEFDQSDSILFVCQRRENFSSSNSIIVYISHEFYIQFPAAHRYPWCNAQSKFALSRSPSSFQQV